MWPRTVWEPHSEKLFGSRDSYSKPEAHVRLTRTPGRPRGLSVDSSPRRRAVDLAQLTSPMGLPRPLYRAILERILRFAALSPRLLAVRKSSDLLLNRRCIQMADDLLRRHASVGDARHAIPADTGITRDNRIAPQDAVGDSRFDVAVLFRKRRWKRRAGWVCTIGS